LKFLNKKMYRTIEDSTSSAPASASSSEPVSSASKYGNHYWKSLFQRDFPNKNTSLPEGPLAAHFWKKRYQHAFEERKQCQITENISPFMRNIFYWIRTNDFPRLKKAIDDAINNQTIQLYGNAFAVIIASELESAISLASYFSRKQMLRYFYDLI